MRRFFTRFVLAGALYGALLASSTRAADQAKEEKTTWEKLPPPREVVTESIAIVPVVNPMYYQRTSRYDVWQNYMVDRSGMFRPRVIYSPSGAYYQYNGKPFPWSQMHPLEWYPSVVD